MVKTSYAEDMCDRALCMVNTRRTVCLEINLI